MTVAILACVHAHLEALTAVLDHAAKEGATEIVCLGDVVGYGVNPRECLKLLLGSRIAILGNHEEALLRQDPADFNANASAWLRWTKAQLTSPAFDRDETDELRRFLGRMREVVEVGDVMYTHGSPRIPTRDYVVPADTRDPDKMREIFDRVKRESASGPASTDEHDAPRGARARGDRPASRDSGPRSQGSLRSRALPG